MTPLDIRRRAAIAQNTQAHPNIRREAIERLVREAPHNDDAHEAIAAINDPIGIGIVRDEQPIRLMVDMAQFHNEPTSVVSDAGSAAMGVLFGAALAALLWVCVDVARWHAAGAEPPVGVEVER